MSFSLTTDFIVSHVVFVFFFFFFVFFFVFVFLFFVFVFFLLVQTALFMVGEDAN